MLLTSEDNLALRDNNTQAPPVCHMEKAAKSEGQLTPQKLRRTKRETKPTTKLTITDCQSKGTPVKLKSQRSHSAHNENDLGSSTSLTTEKLAAADDTSQQFVTDSEDLDDDLDQGSDAVSEERDLPVISRKLWQN